MKKIICLFLCLCFVYTLPACTIEDSPTKELYQNQKEQLPEKKEPVFGLNETAVFSNLKFTATEIKESTGDYFFTPESGNIFVGIKFIIENISDTNQDISSMLLFDGYADDVKCSYSFNAACAFDDTLDGTIAPGKKLVGWYAVEIPSNWSSIALFVQPDWLSNNTAQFVFTK